MVFGSTNDTSAGADIKDVVAANVRRLRIARRLSLSELARATGAGKATLSAIESGRANATVGTLSLVAAALAVPLASLVEEPPFGEVRVVRGARAPGRPAAPRRRVVDAFEVADRLEVVEVDLPARHAEELAAGPAGCREELYVLRGTIIAGPVERISELTAGDYASFPADVPRHLETRRAAARALLLRHGGG